MARKKRHSQVEITAKLAQADALAAEGKLQPEIAQVLGISVMTLHRWRKAGATADVPEATTLGVPIPLGAENRIAELHLENSRLRKLVTDLLLEKMKLEEAANARKLRNTIAERT